MLDCGYATLEVERMAEGDTGTEGLPPITGGLPEWPTPSSPPAFAVPTPTWEAVGRAPFGRVGDACATHT